VRFGEEIEWRRRGLPTRDGVVKRERVSRREWKMKNKKGKVKKKKRGTMGCRHDIGN